MHDLKILANIAGVTQADLLALAPANDPFATHRPARRRDAEWFAELFERFKFGDGVHIRRIHYRIVSDDNGGIIRPDGQPYLNDTSSWSMLVNASRDARYLNLVPAHYFVDRNSPAPVLHFDCGDDGYPEIEAGGLYWSDPGADFPELPSLVYKDAKSGPPALVEIWAEKSTMNDVLVPLARRYGANLIAGKGEMSEIAVRNLMRRARSAGVPARILYVSDFDPAGRSMPVATARKIEFMLGEDSDLDITLDPIVLTDDQCRDYRLPRTPLKDSESRGAKFEERFGAGATELDALEALHPGELKRIVSREIERYIDPDYARAFNVAVSEHKDRLRRISEAIHDQFAPQISVLQDEYRRIYQEFEGFHASAEKVFDEINRHLEHQHVPDFEPPIPRPPSEPPEPLFSSRRDYISQIAAYRKWQGRTAI